MKNLKKVFILTMAMTMIFSITCFADFLVSYGKSSLRPGDSASSSKCTLQSEVKEFYANQSLDAANTTKERLSVYRYDGIFQVKKEVARKDVSISKTQTDLFTRIPLLSSVPYVPEYTNVSLVMKNVGNSSIDIKSGQFFKYR